MLLTLQNALLSRRLYTRGLLLGCWLFAATVAQAGRAAAFPARQSRTESAQSAVQVDALTSTLIVLPPPVPDPTGKVLLSLTARSTNGRDTKRIPEPASLDVWNAIGHRFLQTRAPLIRTAQRPILGSTRQPTVVCRVGSLLQKHRLIRRQSKSCYFEGIP
jgi:hypothetical protein